MEIIVKDFSGTTRPRIFIPPVYEEYRAYIVFAFSVCLYVCV